MYRISVLAAVGPIRARFNGKLTLGDIDSPRGYTLGFEVSGGAAGFGKGGAEVALQPAADGTQLGYKAKAEVDRKSVVLGKRVSVSVDFGGRRIIKKKKLKKHTRIYVLITITISMP